MLHSPWPTDWPSPSSSAGATRWWRPTTCAPATSAGRIPGKGFLRKFWAATDRARHRCGTRAASTRWAPRASCAAWNRQVFRAGVNFDAGNDSHIGDGFDKGSAILLLLADCLVEEDGTTNGLP